MHAAATAQPILVITTVNRQLNKTQGPAPAKPPSANSTEVKPNPSERVRAMAERVVSTVVMNRRTAGIPNSSAPLTGSSTKPPIVS